MEQILGKNCNQIFSGAPYRVQKDQGHLITSVFGIRGTVTGTKSSGALWILLTHPNSGHGRETQNIGCWGYSGTHGGPKKAQNSTKMA